MTEIGEILKYPFVQRALITGSLLVIACALIGSILLSKRLALLTQSLANVAFLGVAVAMTCNLPHILTSLIFVSGTSYHVFERRNKNKGQLQTDNLLALLSNVALALGICLIAYTRGLSIDICNFMFGSVLVIEQNEMLVIIGLCLLVILTYMYLRPYLFAWQLDAHFYLTAKLLPKSLNLLIALLLSALLAAGLKIMGTLLLSSLLLLPALTAKLFAKTAKQVQIFSLLIALIGFYFGLACSYLLYVPSGAAIVVVYALFYLLARLFSNYKTKHKQVLTMFLSLLCLLNLVACQDRSERPEALTDLFSANNSPFKTGEQGQTRDFSRKLGNDSKNKLRTEHLPNGKAEDGSDYLPLKEQQFVLLTNEIYANYKQYMTHTLAFEGVFVSLYDKAISKNRYFVIRYGPGCCAYDGMPGFEVQFPKDYEVGKLADKEWLYVEGKLKINREDKTDYLYIVASKVERNRPAGLLNVKH